MRIFIPFLAVLLGISQGAALFAQSVFFQNDWETLPVFHNGRVMPLHTFAQKTVWEICGTTQPYIVWDDTVIAELNQILEGMQTQTGAENEEAERFRFLNRKHDWVDGGFNRDYSVFEVDNQPPALPAVLPIQELGKTRLTHIADRIRQLLPPKGRYFTADEILLSWIGEPEVWAFIPIFPVPESDYLDEMFGITSQGDARRTTYFVSLYQLENSPRYKQRREDINRRKELGQQPDYPIPFDQITERLENQVRLFRELTYHPCRQMPDRMLAILRQAAGMSREPSPYVSAFEAWSYLLTLGEIPARQTTEPEVPAQELTQIHPTTQRWHNIADKLNLLLRVYRHSDSKGNAVFPNPLIIEEQFENLISLVDANLAESAVLMESIYPGVSFQYTHQYTPDSSGRNFPEAAKLLPRLLLPENEPNRQSVRQIIIGYHFSVKKLRALIESAYLALYDNGLSLRLLPICFPFVQDVPSIQETAGVQPWGTSQMIFGSGNVFIKRFFGLHAPLVSDSAAEIAAESDAAEPETTESETTESKISETNLPEATPLAEPPTDNQVPQTPTTEEELLFRPFSMENGILPLPQNETGGIFSVVRDNLQNILLSYATLGGAYGTADFTGKMQQLQYSIRQAAQNIEHNIEQDIESDKTPLDKSGELAKKTAYPQDNRKLSAEYRYDRISPFFWMGLFALLAVLFNAGAFLASATRSKSAAAQTVWIHSVNDEHSVQVQPENADEKFELLDYTNSFEDRLYITSVCMLLCSIFAAFLGGAMRSAVTGWAPITNMYETVVMMALSTAVLGFWYALHPLLHPALHLAWTLSQFPRIDAVLNGFVSRKPKNADVLPEDFATNQQAVNPEPRRDQMIAQRKLLGQCLTAIPRLILTAATFYGIVLLAYGESVIESGFFAAAAEMFETADSIDLLTIIASVILLVWIIPHVFLTLCLMPALLLRPSWLADEKGILSYETTMSVFENEKSCKPPMSIPSAGLRHSELSGVFRGEHHAGRISQSNSSGAAWLKQTRNALLKRKVFVGITAMIVFGAGLATYLNRGEFNPDIRPIAAVLRSNFWLTVHVTAIVVSYAAAFVAWGMATIALGYVIFGRYVRKPSDTAQNGQTGEQIVQLPSACRMFSPVIARLLRIALLLLIIGTILGARWADYSWGRFWSWDPKEVWALITILFYTIVFHGRIARYYDIVGIMVGALFASIAVIITWYGINFVFKGSVHSYGGGAESNATLFLGMFIAANLLWGTLALLRYCTEMFTPSATLTERKTNV